MTTRPSVVPVSVVTRRCGVKGHTSLRLRPAARLATAFLPDPSSESLRRARHGRAVRDVFPALTRGRRREAVVCAASVMATLAPWVVWVQLHNDALPPLVRGAYGS
jgi:hypothetical protein